MNKVRYLKSALAAGASIIALSSGAFAESFNIPAGGLEDALNTYTAQTGQQLLYPDDLVRGVRTKGAAGEMTAALALSRILKGTGLSTRHEAAAVVIVRSEPDVPQIRIAQMVPMKVAAAAAGIESVVVTSSKIKGDIQTVPIAITALSQEQLTSRQIAGGPDLVKEVPNLTFSKTNFSGYTIQIRGIGTQAISVTTDPAVAVAFNDTPFIRNHFFEQEFFDVNQVEVLRGPQGTLYGRNATAGVVNVVSAKPTDQFEAMASADWGNYLNRRYEGMVNIPVDEDRLDIRVAGEWTKREGYTINTVTGSNVDGRNLWSARATIGWKPTQDIQAYLVWEHFSENDDRMRTAKQLCKTDPGLSSVAGVHVPIPGEEGGGPVIQAFTITTGYLSQGCLPSSLYAPQAFGVPNGYSLPYVVAGWVSNAVRISDPYASTTQSTDLRNIETEIDPRYQAKNDTLELNADYNITPTLTFTSATGYNNDYLWSTEDYNRFDTAPGIFQQLPFGEYQQSIVRPDGNFVCSDGSIHSSSDACSSMGQGYTPTGVFCDPQLGCSNRLVAQDISTEHAWQLSQEFRLASNFAGPFNFSVGGNYMHYETVEDYYVFANTLTLFAASFGGAGAPAWRGGLNEWVPGVSDNSNCLRNGASVAGQEGGFQYHDPNLGAGVPTEVCYYIDPNPLSSLNGEGHNYFRSDNPYVLNSYAGFGEAYYNVADDLKLTGGLRWTDDQKYFIDIPSELLVEGYGYEHTGTVVQKWNELTGRLAANWTPKLDFTDQTLIYGSFAHGYKAGGANPPGAVIFSYNGGINGVPVHPLTFKPEFVNAFELGSKNTLMDGGLTLNGDVFFYNYKGYQISEIVDRTSINLNFDSTVKGAELEASYEPLPGLKFNFAGGYEDTRIKDGQSSVDLMDRTAGRPGWVLFKPFVTEPSNCVLPAYVVAAAIQGYFAGSVGNQAVSICDFAYVQHEDPLTLSPYDYSGPPTGNNGAILSRIDPPYPGYDPLSVDPAAPADVNNGLGLPENNGAGFSKQLGGNKLPNAPRFTVSLSGEYTMPVSEDWAATLHSDFYWQSQSFARVFNDEPYDKIRGYSNVNLALILTSGSGWQVMGYLKNVFDTTAITGTFLNSDDSGLTTNVFLTDPRLYGVRVTKNW